MTQKQRVKTDVVEGEAIPEPRSAAESQLVPLGSMDVDSSTGAPIRVGVPETNDTDTIAEFVLWLQEKSENSNEDSMSRLADMLRRSHTAESVAEALREKRTVNGLDFVARPFMATGFTIHEGKFEDEEIPYFASIDATDPDHPDGFIINCGGDKILVHIQSLDRLNAFPIALCITSKTTRRGRTVLSFEVLEQNRG